tara:strand:- start:2994 stop:3503 length:510 start_codon:yes stop_codon:yes gene_type:complete
MPNKDSHFFGTIFKLHGYKGHLDIRCEKIPENFHKINSILIQLEGQFIPFIIKEIKKKNEQVLLVKLKGIDTEEDAMALLKKDIFVKKKFLILNKDENLEGLNVFDKNYGFLGEVEFIDRRTAQKLIVVKTKDKSILIPFHPKFVISIGKDVRVCVPKDLLEINNIFNE